jgi:hypothetical protein
MMDPGELTEIDHRQHRILDALFKFLEKQGAKAKEERGTLSITLQGEQIDFQLRQKMKQNHRPLTDDEKRWSIPGDKSWRQELQPIGKFVFSFKTYLPSGLRTEWLESDTKSMEELLPDIVATFVAAAPLLVEQRKKREENERLRQIAERQRYEERQRRKLDDNRWRRFVEFSKQQREAELARDFLQTLRPYELRPNAGAHP